MPVGHKPEQSLGEILRANGVSRRRFMKFCTATVSALALPPWLASAMADQLAANPRPCVIYLSFQECTGCFESLTCSFSPTIENLLFNVISLDYDDTLMAACDGAAEAAKQQAMKEHYGRYVLIVDGAIPTGAGGAYCTAGGKSAVESLKEAAAGAGVIISVGTCAAFGGIQAARPNPTGARPVSALVTDRPIINVSGCPPIPEVITGTLLQYVTTGKLPELDGQGRPKVFYGNNIHDRCYRRPFYDEGKFAKTFDDEGARNGWCLYELGCKGPTTYNACATVKWNGGTSFPIESGHGCIGCSEPDFWDKGTLYAAESTPDWGSSDEARPHTALAIGGGAVVAGIALGAVSAGVSRSRQRHLEDDAAARDRDGVEK